MGMAALLLVVGFERADGQRTEIEVPGIKFKGAAGPVVLWMLAFLTMATGGKMFWN